MTRVGFLVAALVTSLVAAPANAGESPPDPARAAGTARTAAEPAAIPDDESGTGDRPAAENGVEAVALAEARRAGEPVEIEQRRTETRQVFANPSGTFTLEQYARPVRVRQGGEWAEIDTTLRRGADGGVAPVATAGRLRMSGGGDSAMVTLGEPGEQLGLRWPGTLPEPELDGPTATYPEVMPGVDLRVTAQADGFSQVLVVKNRQAARSDRLRRLTYPIRTDGLDLEVTDDGTTVATDPDGGVVFTSGAPMMWDSDAAEARQRGVQADTLPGAHARMDLTLAGDGARRSLTVEPSAELLTSEDTTYPVYIDPSFAGRQYRWTHVNKTFPNQSYWNYDRGQGAKVGYSSWTSPAVTYRSFFQMGTRAISGSRVKDAYFAITLDHSASCQMTKVDLWHTRSIDPAQALTWNNSGGHWLSYRASAYGRANFSSCSQPAMGMEFASGGLTRLMQGVADRGAGHVALGLRSPNESDRMLWKRFQADTARIVVEYNNVPRAPERLNFRRPLPCGTADDPTPISDDEPQFAAIASDPDGQNLTTVLQIHDESGALAHEVRSSTTTSGAAFSWPQLPAGKLREGERYSYRAYSNDGADNGPATERCYFTVDWTEPGVPSVQSDDFPDGEPVLPARTTGTVTFVPASGDTDVAEYVYGFQQDRMTMRVKAAADGTAQAPVTVWERFGRRLYVKAVDRAGNVSETTPVWDLEVLSNPDPVTHVDGDVNGDGRADVTAVFDHGFGRTAVWNITAREDGFHSGTIAWDSGTGGGFPLFRVRPVSGDFDGDGRTDMALFREGAGREVSLYPLVSDGNRYNAQPAIWTSPEPGWSLNRARTDTGDVDGDGLADIVVQLWNTDDTRRVLVFPGADLSAPQVWLDGDVADPDHQVTPLLADIDGDGVDDLASVRGHESCRTVVELNRSTGTSFSSDTEILHDGGTDGFCWQRGKFTVGDVDGDDRDDLVAAYEYSVDDVGLWVLRSTGTALDPREWWRGGGGFDLGKAALSTGDYTLDGRDDLAVVYACCGDGSRQVWTFESTGEAFGAKSVDWHDPVDAVPGPSFHLEHRSYEIVARHSGKCLNVKQASSADGTSMIQWPCVGSALNERFRLVPVFGTDRYEVRAVHSMKCADVFRSRHGDGEPVRQHDCHGGANQQVTVEYVDGSSYETVVRLRFAHSGKCANVAGGSTADRAPLEQRGCGGMPSQQWTLRPTVNPQLDGRYKIHAEVSDGRVLDVTDCRVEDGAEVRIWDWISGSPCQQWRLEPQGDDLYRIVDPNSGKSLDIQGCSTRNRATVHLWTTGGSDCQTWRIEPSAGGTYSILSASTGKSLDVAGCSSSRGAEVITWNYWGGACQRWFLDRQ